MSFHIAETQTQLLVVNGGSSSINFSVLETLADQSLSAGLMARSKALGRRLHSKRTANPNSSLRESGRPDMILKTIL
jgi:acetate kinase